MAELLTAATGLMAIGIAVFMLMFYLGPGDQSTFGWLFSTVFG